MAAGRGHTSPVIPGWPEWHDSDVASERWEPAVSKPADPKKKDTAPSSPLMPPCFEDPDGKIFLPPPLRAVQWKKPQELNLGKLLVIRDNVYDADFDLISTNGHLFDCELMRIIISQIVSLAFLSTRNAFMPDPIQGSFMPCDSISWKPWHNVYSNCKTGHIVHNPLTNTYGKYVIRIYYMGNWRKVYVDDMLPVDAQGRLLLPCNSLVRHELWPMLLTKGLLKLASLECSFTGSHHYKVIEFNAVECLTGWIPEPFELQLKDNPDDVWPVLLSILRKYRFPLKNRSSTPGEMESEETVSRKSMYGKAAKVVKKLDSSRHVSPTDIASTPDDLWDEFGFNPNANICVFAELREITPFMSDVRKEEIHSIMKDFGLDSMKKYPILLMEARMSPVEAPTAPSGIPRWKLIRRHLWDREFIKLKGVDSDEDPIRSVGLVLPWSIHQNFKTATSEESTPTLLELGIKEESTEYGFHKPFSTQRVDWINHERLCKLFGRLTVFHRPNGYIVTERAQDARVHAGTGHNSPNRKVAGAKGGIPPFSWFFSGVPFYLFADSVRESKVLLALALGSTGCPSERTTTSESTSEQSGADSRALSGSSSLSASFTFPGGILIEPYYWRLQATGRSICNLKVARNKGIYILLPAGRHVLRVTVKATSPGLLTVCSNHQITLSDEDNILLRVTGDPSSSFVTELLPTTQPSSRSRPLHKCLITGLGSTLRPPDGSLDIPPRNSTMILMEAGKTAALDLLDCFQMFSEPKAFRTAQSRLYKTICPGLTSVNLSAYLEAFNEIFFITFAKLMDKVTLDVIFAARAFTLDMSMPFSHKQVGFHGYFAFAQRKSLKKTSPPLPQEQATPMSLIEEFVQRYREIGLRFTKAAIVLQKNARRYLARKTVQAMIPLSKPNVRVSEQLLKAATVLEKNLEEHGCSMLTNLFLLHPACVFDFPFWTDELNHVSYHDYSGIMPILQPRSWFALYRDVFHVTDALPIVTTFSSDLPSCSVHVVNNDTALEIPQVFMKPDYYEYFPNKYGYSVLIEGCVREIYVNPCKWKLRLICPAAGYFTPMPKDSSTVLMTKEIKEYFIPNRDGVLTRVALTTALENVATIQCSLSASDVNVIISVYDGKQIVRSASGKGHALMSAIMLHHQQRGDGQTTPPNIPHSGLPRKYIVEARIEKDSWLVHMSHVPFINGLMLKERAESLGEPEKPEKGGTTTVVDKKKKKEKQVVHESKVDVKTCTDPSKPHWTLRIVLDQNLAEGVDIKRDTSRADEITGMKRKWDPDESGRNAEAERLRVAFLQTNAEITEPSTSPGEQSPLRRSGEPSPSFSPHKGSVAGTHHKPRHVPPDMELVEAEQMVAPQPLPTKIRLKAFDITPYYHYHPFGPRVKDTKLEQAQRMAKEQRWKEYLDKREMFASVRKQQDDRRHQEKLLLSDQAETWQAKLEAIRHERQQNREALRLKKIEDNARNKVLLHTAIEEARAMLETDPKRKLTGQAQKKK